MTVIYVLLVAHFVGDFICQTDWMAVNKSKNWEALAVHVFVYIAVIAVSLVPVAGTPGVASDANNGVLLFLGVNWIAHFVQDAVTSRINARLWFIDLGPGKANFAEYGWTHYARVHEGRRHWFFVGIGADQLLHYVTLFVTAGWWL